MKKVRYMIGAAGALAVTPALGVFVTTANASTGQIAARNSGKTVSLSQNTASPAVSRCGFLLNVSAIAGKGANTFEGNAFFSSQTGQCVDYTKGDLHHSQVGLEMRTRLYRNGVQVHQGYVHGHATIANTRFSSQPRVVANQACEALVYSDNLGRVAYGPVCENIPK